MSIPALSTGAIRKVFLQNDTSGSPCLQVIEFKRIQNQSTQGQADRYRLILQDGEFCQQAMLATQLNSQVAKDGIGAGSIVRLKKFKCNLLAGRRSILILEIECLVKGPIDKIGSPVSVEAAAQEDATLGESKLQPVSASQAPKSLQVKSQPAAAAAAAPLNVAQQQFGGQQQQQQHSHQSASSAAGAQAHSSAQSGIDSRIPSLVPIASIHPRLWQCTIRARVTKKNDIKQWHNAKSQGHLFSVDLLDAQGGEIRATAFNEAAHRLHAHLRVGMVYLIRNAQVKAARYASQRHECELALNSNTQIEVVDEDPQIEQQRNFAFQHQLAALADLDTNQFVDMIGVVTHVGPSQMITTKKQTEVAKRVVTLCDQSLTPIALTLWAEAAQIYNEDSLANNPVLAVKNACVSDYHGRSLNVTFGSDVSLAPDCAETNALVQWWAKEGSQQQSAPMSSQADTSDIQGSGGATGRKLLIQVRTEELGMHERPDFLVVRGMITAVKHDFEKPPYYLACPAPNCSKKVMPGAQGEYVCAKCSKSYPNFEPRYILSLLICDATDSIWVNCFNDQAEFILKVAAREVYEMKQRGDEEAFCSELA